MCRAFSFELAEQLYEDPPLACIEGRQCFGGGVPRRMTRSLHKLVARLGQRDCQTSAVLPIGARLGQSTRDKAVDHALYGRGIHRGQTAKQILRARPTLVETRERGPLGRRHIICHVCYEDRRVTLSCLAKQETDLRIEQISPALHLVPALSRGNMLGLALRHETSLDRAGEAARLFAH